MKDSTRAKEVDARQRTFSRRDLLQGAGAAAVVGAGADPAVFTQLLAELEADRPATLAAFGSRFFQTKVSSQFGEWFQEISLAASPQATIAGGVALRDSDLVPDMAKVSVPTAILHGVHDQIVPFALGQVQAGGIAGAQLIAFENSGHGLFYDEKDKFNTTLMQFAG